LALHYARAAAARTQADGIVQKPGGQGCFRRLNHVRADRSDVHAFDRLLRTLHPDAVVDVIPGYFGKRTQRGSSMHSPAESANRPLRLHRRLHPARDAARLEEDACAPLAQNGEAFLNKLVRIKWFWKRWGRAFPYYLRPTCIWGG
jgi:hypothetical protein